jgi:hypothetical protein
MHVEKYLLMRTYAYEYFKLKRFFLNTRILIDMVKGDPNQLPATVISKENQR